MFSQTTIIGRLTRDPESEYTPSGLLYCKFAVAVDRDYKDKETGEKQTDFYDCVAWRNTAEFIGQYITKGRLVVCSGRLQSRKFTGDDGANRTFWQLNVDKVSALDRPKNENGDEKREEPAPSKQKTKPAKKEPQAEEIDEADPFAEE